MTPEDDVERSLAEAAALGDEERWEEASAVLAGASDRHPDDATLLGWQGAAARARGAHGEAYDFFRRCLLLEPADPALLALAGEGLAAMDDPEAESTLRLAALTGPNVVVARLAYGRYLTREGMLDEAIRELSAARDLDPGDAATTGLLAAAYLRAGRPEEAVATWEQGPGAAGDQAASRALYALALLEADRLTDSAEELHLASLEAPEDAGLQLLTALACATQEWEDQADEALLRAEHFSAGADAALLHEVAEAVAAGPDAARSFLHDELAPVELRERLRRFPD
ncbi:hypothetical protein BH20GEM2_BH20GEM2_07730 [soil metagenome]